MKEVGGPSGPSPPLQFFYLYLFFFFFEEFFIGFFSAEKLIMA